MGSYWSAAPDDRTLFGYLTSASTATVEAALKQFWEQEDTNKSGFLERKEAQVFFGKLYDYLSNSVTFLSRKEDLVDAWIDSFDDDKDGKISWEEFKQSVVALIKSPTLSVDQLAPKKEIYNVLTIYKLNLTELPSMDSGGGKSDPYVTVTTVIAHKEDKRSTATINDTDNPEFYPNFVYFPSKPVSDVVFNVVDDDYYGDDAIGAFVIKGEEIAKHFITSDGPIDEPMIFTISGPIILTNAYGALDIAKKEGKNPQFSVEFHYQKWEVNYGFEKNVNTSMNYFNRMFWMAMAQSKPAPVKANAVPPPTIKKKPYLHQFSDHIQIATEDYTHPPNGYAASALCRLICQLPFNENEEITPWTNRSEGIEAIGRIMGQHIPPATEGDWLEVTKDKTMTRFFFQGVGATRIAKAADGKSFEANFDHLATIPVRAGYVPYQGKAVFNLDGTIRHIEFQKQIIKPGDSRWDHMKFLLRSTALIMVTAQEHLVHGHFTWSNLTTIAITTHLNPDHPVRRLCHIHTYRAALVNSNAVDLLVPDGGALLRVVSFTYPTLRTVLDDTFVNYKYETYAQYLKRTGMHDVDPKLFPPGQDGMDYWNVVHKYVSSYLRVFYANDQALLEDVEFFTFWKAYSESFPSGLPEPTLDSVAEVLTQFIFYVTGMHTHVGTVAAYARDPAFAAGCVGEGQILSFPQNFYCQAIITVGTSGDMPAVLDNWSHLMPNDESKKVFDQFHEDLVALSKTIDERNNTRTVYNNFNPKYIETSISV